MENQEAKIIKFPKVKKPRKARRKAIKKPKVSTFEVITISLGILVGDMVFELFKMLLKLIVH